MCARICVIFLSCRYIKEMESRVRVRYDDQVLCLQKERDRALDTAAHADRAAARAEQDLVVVQERLRQAEREVDRSRLRTSGPSIGTGTAGAGGGGGGGGLVSSPGRADMTRSPRRHTLRFDVTRGASASPTRARGGELGYPFRSEAYRTPYDGDITSAALDSFISRVEDLSRNNSRYG